MLISSIFFYYSLLPYYLILFFALTLLNYYIGIVVQGAGERKKTIFVFSIVSNIFVLALFKYYGFFESLFKDILQLSASNALLKIILPIGLSYFIFCIICYLIELKRGKIEAEKHFGIFATSLLFFPKIMQGPIERPHEMFPQFKEIKRFDYERVVEGLKQILWGVFKKLVVADRIALYVDAVYGNVQHHGGFTLLVATFLFAIQIYADFSAYTDIALGSARILGFNLTENFKRPYFAQSVKEFWDRWHISFSTWLRDYIFLPLAYYISRRLPKTSYLGVSTEKWIFLIASMVTFLICGIWHGEGVNFLFWGILFGVYLTIANWTLGISKVFRRAIGVSKSSGLYKIYGILFTFMLISFAWIFFRANSFQQAIYVIQKIFTLDSGFFIGTPSYFVYSLIGVFILFAADFNEEFLKGRYSLFNHQFLVVRYTAYSAVLIIILLVGVFDGGQFIYFQF